MGGEGAKGKRPRVPKCLICSRQVGGKPGQCRGHMADKEHAPFGNSGFSYGTFSGPSRKATHPETPGLSMGGAPVENLRSNQPETPRNVPRKASIVSFNGATDGGRPEGDNPVPAESRPLDDVDEDELDKMARLNLRLLRTERVRVRFDLDEEDKRQGHRTRDHLRKESMAGEEAKNAGRGRVSNAEWAALMGLSACELSSLEDTGAVGRTSPWGTRGWFEKLFGDAAKLCGTQRVRVGEQEDTDPEKPKKAEYDWFASVVPTLKTGLLAEPSIVSLRLLARLAVFMAFRQRTSTTPLLLRTKCAQYAKELGMSAEQLALVMHGSITLAMVTTGKERGAWSWLSGWAGNTMLSWSEKLRQGLVSESSTWRIWVARGLIVGTFGLMYSQTPIGGLLYWILMWFVHTKLALYIALITGWLMTLGWVSRWAILGSRGSRLSSPA